MIGSFVGAELGSPRPPPVDTGQGVLISAGGAASAFVGTEVHDGVLATAGISANAFVGTEIHDLSFSAAGVASVDMKSASFTVTSTQVIDMPVDYVLAGNQRDRLKQRRRFSSAIMKNIFRE